MRIWVTLVLYLATCLFLRAAWFPSEVHHVRAYVYDYTQSMGMDGYTSFLQNGELHPGVLSDGGLLMSAEQTKLLAIALGFEIEADASELEYFTEDEAAEAQLEDALEDLDSWRSGAWGSMPHHGFIFYDKAGSVLGYVQICLLCQNGRASLKVIPEEHWNFKLLRKLVGDLKLPMYQSNFEYAVLFREKCKGAGGMYYLPAIIHGRAKTLDFPLLIRNLSVRE